MFDDRATQPTGRVTGPLDYGLRDLDASRTEDVLEAYSLLQEALGNDSVEDLRSFRRTVSPLSDQSIIPRVVYAHYDYEMIGVVVGATLKNLDAGFIAYSAVKEAWRRRGIYTRMRDDLLRRFTNDDGVRYVVSELDEQDWLYSKYVGDWSAVALPVYYEQPQAQGLGAKPLTLVAQPLGNGTTPGPSETLALVREVYERMYGIADVDRDESFRRVLASLAPNGQLPDNRCNGTDGK